MKNKSLDGTIFKKCSKPTFAVEYLSEKILKLTFTIWSCLRNGSFGFKIYSNISQHSKNTTFMIRKLILINNFYAVIIIFYKDSSLLWYCVQIKIQNKTSKMTLLIKKIH